MRVDIIIHADDFGITLDQSKDILACSEGCGGEGALNSTSALVTSPAFGECAEFARPFVDAGLIRMGLHLNLVEGPALSSPEEAPLLVGDDGRFQMSFAKTLTVSAGPLHDTLMREVCRETRAQIREFLRLFPTLQEHLRLDSHQHFHLIPAVFEGVLAAVEEEGCTLEYLRIPAEPLSPYLKAPGTRRHVSAVNIVKNQLLNGLWRRCAPKYPASLPDPAVFYGLALSGRMQHVADEDFLRDAVGRAGREGRDVELLFHPGGVPSVDDCLNPSLKGFCQFYLSDNRQAEADILRKLPLRTMTV